MIEEKHQVGLNIEVVAKYEDIGPEQAPRSGHKWSRTTDLPRVEARLTIKSTSGTVPEAIREPDTFCFGEQLRSNWGAKGVSGGSRYRTRTYTGEQVADAFDEAQADVREAIRVLRRIASKRAARLAARKETMRLAREGSPFKRVERQERVALRANADGVELGVGDLVSAGGPGTKNFDQGRVTGFINDYHARVAWDGSQVTTIMPCDTLRPGHENAWPAQNNR